MFPFIEITSILPDPKIFRNNLSRIFGTGFEEQDFHNKISRTHEIHS